ncbi:NUDIX hydrolase [Chloroflexota bacterium]
MIGVGAIIEDAAGRILLAKHIPEREGFWQGKWICPGGKLELGETIENGIKREVREETQLEVDLIKALPAFDTIVRSNGDIALHVIYIDYLARVSGGSLKAGDDIGEAVWVEKTRLAEIWPELHDDTKRLFRIAGIIDTKN